MDKTGKASFDPEDLRAEYKAASDFHQHQVGTRFTIAALYLPALGFLAQAALQTGASWKVRLAASSLGFLISLCVWILELRTRTIYTSIAHRLMDIEHYHWHIEGADWYQGFMSRLFKEPPPRSYSRLSEVPEPPGPDRPHLSWMSKPLPPRLSSYISHSTAFDILYLGSLLFWFMFLVVSLYGVFIVPLLTLTLTSTPTFTSTPIATGTPLPTPTFSVTLPASPPTTITLVPTNAP